jgi:DNA-binding winged helix-turn-helix (wHTH) protein/Flp pilus assembly protein TadD
MSLYEFGPFHLDAERLLLSQRGVPIAVGPKVVETLLALIEHPGDVFAKAALIERIWPEGYVDEANLAQNVYVLRKILRDRWNVEAIETIPRRGYRFVAPVSRRDDVARSEPVPAPAPAKRPRFAAFAAAVVVAVIGVFALTMALSRGNSRPPTLSMEGARLYEIGRYYWNLRTRDAVNKSVAYFERVVAIDPRDPRGYAALASANAIVADYNYGPAPIKVYIARARAYAREALAIDPNCGEAYAVLGMIASKKWYGVPARPGEALSDLRRAIALDPSSGPAHEWYGIALLELNRVHEASAELAKAAELDPLSVATTAWLGTTAYLQGRYADAVAYSRETLDLSPQRQDAYETLGLAYEALGNQKAAAGAFHKLAELCSMCRPQAAALLAPISARTHQMALAKVQLQMAADHSTDVAPQDLAAAFEAVGRHRAALGWLRRMHGEYLEAEIANDPRFAGLRRELAGTLAQKAG